MLTFLCEISACDDDNDYLLEIESTIYLGFLCLFDYGRIKKKQKNKRIIED